MKILTNKNFIQKMLIVLVILLLFNFIAPTYSHAGIGGTLIDPIQSLVLGIGDAVMWGLQKMIFGMDQSIIYVDNGESFWSEFWGGFAAVVGAIGIVALTIVTGGIFVISVGGTIIASAAMGYAAYAISKDVLPDDLYLPLFILSPQEIFAGKVPILDINFIEQKTNDKATETEGNENISSPMATPAYMLRNVIARWYIILRNIAFVGLLSILIFIGIRITMTSIAAEKAKYKNMIVDWIVAMCLLLLMQFFMSFMLNLTEAITNIFNNQNREVVVELPMTDKMEKALGGKPEGLETNANGDEILKWPTNFTGVARLESQLGKQYSDTETNQILHELSYTIMYIALIGMTVTFLVTYLRRVLYMAFLTIIAPLVVLTYPIDKITDGKAQAFNMWFKEYAYNILIQPFHLLLYMILVGTAMDFAKSNLFYALVALGFISTAEKLLRKFFGFEKAGTVGALGGFVGGALATKMFGKFGRSSHKGNEQKTNKKEEDKIRKTDTTTNPYELIGRNNSQESGAQENPTEHTEEDRDIDNGQPRQEEDSYRSNNDETQDDLHTPDNDETNEDGSRNTQRQGERDYKHHTLDELMNFDPEEQRERDRDRDRQENLDRMNNEEMERRQNDPERQRMIERSNQNIRRRERKKDIRRRVGSAALYTAKKGAVYAGKKAAKFTGKAVLRGGLALGAGMVGLGLGALSGSPSTAFQATAAAVTGGYMTGRKIERTAGKLASSRGGGGPVNTFREGYHGKKEFAKIQVKEQFMQDKVTKESFKNMYPDENSPNKMSKQAKENMKRASEYAVEGINDYDDMGRALKMEDAGMSRESVMAAFKLSKKYDKGMLLDAKTNKRVHETIVENLQKRGYKGNAKKQASQTIRMMRMAQGIDTIQKL